jgi:mannitol-specific phosphotransferase system IIBC component
VVPDRLRDRPTPDLIVFILTVVVAVCVFALVVALLVSSIWFPDHDVASLSQRVGTILSSLIGAIIGYLAGRSVNDKTSG